MERPVNTGIMTGIADTNNTTTFYNPLDKVKADLKAAETDLEQVKDDLEKTYKILDKNDQCTYDEILYFENEMFDRVDTLPRFFIEIQKTIIVCILLGICFNVILMLILWWLLA